MLKLRKITNAWRWPCAALLLGLWGCEAPPDGSSNTSPQEPETQAQGEEAAPPRGLFPDGITEISLPLESGARETRMTLDYDGGVLPRVGDRAVLESNAGGLWQAVGEARVIHVGERRLTLRMSTGSAQAATRVRILASAVHRCDLAAASPHDRWAVVPGVPYAEINIGAIEKCSQAVGKYPITPRFQFQLGRALDAHQQEKAAVARYRRALLLEPRYPAALMAVGGKYVNGEGVERNVAEGIRLLGQAHEMGLTRAGFLLARIHEQGVDGLAADVDQAFALYTAAAEAGDLPAQLRLAEAYEQGELGGEPLISDPASALYWRERAAEQGHVSSQFRIGQAYARGEGRDQDWAKARRWWDLAANKGMVEAQLALAELFESGRGGDSPDPGKAVYWYRQAARQGNAMGQYHLGRMYAQGLGVDKDMDKAREWLQLARKQGVLEADRWLQPETPIVTRVEQEETSPAPTSKRADSGIKVRNLRDAARWRVITQGYMDAACRDILIEELADLDINVVGPGGRPDVKLVISINRPQYYSSNLGPFSFDGYNIQYRGEVIRLQDNIRMFYSYGDEDGDDQSEACEDALDEIMDDLEDKLD